jgi:dsRNA-specific ribonuclease
MQQDSPIKSIYDFARRNKIFIEYRFEKESGPAHAKMYTVRLHLAEKNYVGTDRSIKLAQRTAAQLALDDCRSLPLTTNMNVVSCPITALNTWATRNHLSIQYILLNEQFLSTPLNRSRTVFYYRLYLGQDLYFDGHGSTHQQARINCALNAFYFLRQNPPSPPSTPQSSSSPPTSKTKSEISLMYERAKQLALPVRLESNDPFTVTYYIGEKYSATGKGFNKHSAKQSAAEKILELLPKTNNPITRIYQLAQIRQVKIEFIQLSIKENYHFQIKFGDHEYAEGSGKTKQLAKRAAAEILLEKLDPIVVLPPPPTKGLLKRDGNKQEKKHVHFVEEVIEKDEQISPRQSSNYSNKQELIDVCQKLQIHVEYFDEMNKNDNSGSSRYQSIVSLSTTDRLLAQFRGQGPSLYRAQENASSAAWTNLKQLFNGSIQAPK